MTRLFSRTRRPSFGLLIKLVSNELLSKDDKKKLSKALAIDLELTLATRALVDKPEVASNRVGVFNVPAPFGKPFTAVIQQSAEQKFIRLAEISVAIGYTRNRLSSQFVRIKRGKGEWRWEFGRTLIKAANQLYGDNVVDVKSWSILLARELGDSSFEEDFQGPKPVTAISFTKRPTNWARTPHFF